MATFNRPLVPSFLQKLDDMLLRNYPAIWQTRAHLVLYYSLLVAAAIFGLSFISYGNAKDDSSVTGMVTFTILISLLGLVIWVIYLLRFNVFKRFGQWRSTDSLLAYFFFTLCVAAIISICFIPSAVQTMRANQQYGNEEVVQDINEINRTACLLEYDILDLDWRPDTCRLISKWEENAVRVTVVDTTAEEIIKKENNYTRIDTNDYRRRMSETDSVVKLTDSLFIFYSVPDYLFVNSYNADEYTREKILSSAQIYRTYLKTRPNPDRAVLLARLQALASKWAAPGHSYNDNYTITSMEENYTVRIRKKYQLGAADYGIENVVDKKYEWKNNGGAYYRLIWYFTLTITLLLFIYRHSTTRTFFLSILTAVLLSILTGLMMLGGGGGSNGESFYIFLVFYYLLFGVISLVIFTSRSRSVTQGIALNLFTFLTPFMPLVIASLYVISKRYAYLHNRTIEGAVYYGMPDDFDSGPVYLLAELAGPVLFLILLQFLIRKLYRKWQAAPEQ